MAKTFTVYGIKNCNTMKKTFNWLDENNIEYEFHDYKKLGADEGLLEKALKKYGWETVLNTRGTTWRKLPEGKRNKMNNDNAFKVAVDNPSIIKRPIIPVSRKMVFGFDEETYNDIFL